MEITFGRADGSTYTYNCRDAADAAAKLLADVLPGIAARYAADGRKLLNAKMVAAPEGKWTETRTLQGGHTETRAMRIAVTTESLRPAAASYAPRMPTGLTARQRDEWRYDQGVNEGGEGYNPHRSGSARTYPVRGR